LNAFVLVLPPFVFGIIIICGSSVPAREIC
jgi:hypothetical protein